MLRADTGMRILTLVSGGAALEESTRLSREIRAFNAEVDFRLRFLHIEIEEVLCAPVSLREALAGATERAEIRPVPEEGPLLAAATLALLFREERPEVVVLVGSGPLAEPALAAARAAGRQVAVYGAGHPGPAGSIDLGTDAAVAVERLSRVAREVV